MFPRNLNNILVFLFYIARPLFDPPWKYLIWVINGNEIEKMAYILGYKAYGVIDQFASHIYSTTCAFDFHPLKCICVTQMDYSTRLEIVILGTIG